VLGVPEQVPPTSRTDGEPISSSKLIGGQRLSRKRLRQTFFLLNLLAYQETWGQGLHKTQFGVPGFRALTVMTSQQSVRHLVNACQMFTGEASRLFLLPTKRGLARESPLPISG
jgi:hypothetical protein